MSTPADALPGEEQDSPGLAAHALGALAAVRDLVHDAAGLAALEARLAGVSLAGVLFSALTAAFTVMSVWILLQAVAAVLLVQAGVAVLATLLGLLALNALATLLLLIAIRRLSRNLMFHATREALLKRHDGPTQA